MWQRGSYFDPDRSTMNIGISRHCSQRKEISHIESELAKFPVDA